MPQKTTRYEKLLEAVPDALVGLDQKGVIRFVNRQTESLFGFGRDELIGQHIDTLVPEPLWQIYAEHRDDYFAHPRAHSSGLDLELSGRHRDGTELPINITVSNIDTGDVLLVITALGDGDRRRHVVQNLELTRAVVECSDDAIVSTTPGGIITGWNPAAEKMYGYSGREVIGKSGLSLLPEERAGEWNAVLASVKNGQVLKDVQNFALPRKDGALVPISITVSPIRDQEGEVVGVVSVHRDIREQRQAFEAAQRMAAIVDSSDDAIIGETLDGLVTSWNPAAAGMFGYSAAEIIGRPVSLLIPEAQAGDAESVFARLRAGRQVAPIDTFNKRRDGTVFPISLTASPVRDESGAVVGASVIARDVTEQRRAEEALADASQQYRLLAENASDVVYLAGPDHRVVWIAPSVTAALGWDPEELVGTEMVDLLRPEYRATTARDRVELFTLEQEANPEGGFLFELRAKSGDYRWMSGQAHALTDSAGTPLGVAVGVRDVTELMRAREKAQAGEAALRATADSLLDPYVRLEAVRDESGQIVDFVYTDANPAACAYNRLDYADLVGSRLLDRQPGSTGAGLLAQYRQVVETGQPLVLDDVIYAQELLGGQERHYDVRAARVGDGLTYTWRDVTDRQAAAQWLGESQEHYRLLAENASDVVMRLSPDRRYEWVSGSIVDVLGQAATDLVGRVIDEFIHPEDLDAFRHAVADASPERATSSEFRFRRSDGRYRWVLCHTRLNVAKDGTAVALVGGLVDIDARKEVEAQEVDRLLTLERFQRLTVGRELKMIELKKEIETLRGLVHGDVHETVTSTTDAPSTDQQAQSTDR